MKKIIRTAATFISITLLTVTLSAQTPPPPNGGSGAPNGNNNTPVGGGGAPIGSGLAILLALGAAYGGTKVYNFNKRKLAE